MQVRRKATLKLLETNHSFLTLSQHCDKNCEDIILRSDTEISNLVSGTPDSGYYQWDSYPQQDADSTGHANLAHTNHCHLIPGRLRGAAEQRRDQLVQH